MVEHHAEIDPLATLYEAVCGPNNQQSLVRETMRISARLDVLEARFKTVLSVASFLGLLLGIAGNAWHMLKGGQ